MRELRPKACTMISSSIPRFAMTHIDPPQTLPTAEARNKALRAAMRQIQQDFGQGAVMFLGERPKADIEVIPTGALSLDAALGIGGYPRGRIVEIFGGEASGKTTLALHAIAEVQRMGGTAVFIDAEHAFHPEYAQHLGVVTDQLLIAQPDSGEEALDIADTLIRSGAVDLVVVDSVAALTPKAEIAGEMGDAKIGLQARLMSQALRKITASLSKTRTTCIFLNQMREKINGTFGALEVTTGGHALKFYASLRLEVQRYSWVREDERRIGALTRVKVVKNKLSSPFTQCDFELIFGDGIAPTNELIRLALLHGVLKQSGSWYSFGQQHLAQGKEALQRVLQGDATLAAALTTAVREALAKAYARPFTT